MEKWGLVLRRNNIDRDRAVHVSLDIVLNSHVLAHPVEYDIAGYLA